MPSDSRLKFLRNSELRAEIAYAVGGDPTRYDSGRPALLKEELVRIARDVQPDADDTDLEALDLNGLYERICRWAGGEWQPNAGNPHGINRENLKLIHDALDAKPVKEIVTDGGIDESTSGSPRVEHEEHEPLVARIEKSYLVEYLNAVTAVVDEARVQINEDGLRIEAVDSANVVMVEATLQKEVFTKYEAGSDLIGVNVDELQRVLGQLSDDGFVTLLHDPVRQVLIVQDDPFHYDLGLKDPDAMRLEPNLPELELAATMSLNGERFARAVSFFDENTDQVTIGFDEVGEALWFEADGCGWSDAEAGARFDAGHLDGISDAGEAESRFDLDYLSDLAEPIPDDRQVTVKVGEEFPIVLSYGIGFEPTGPDSGTFRGEVTFVQAPRLQQ